MLYFSTNVESCKEKISPLFNRTPTEQELFKASSVKGRLWCVIAIPKHLTQALVWPIIHAVRSVALVAVAILATPVCALNEVCCQGNCKRTFANTKVTLLNATYDLINVVLAPVVQVLKAVNAVFGVVHPGLYFKPDSSSAPLVQSKTLIPPADLSLTVDGNNLKIVCETDTPVVYPLATLNMIVSVLKNNPNISEMEVNFISKLMHSRTIDAGGVVKDFISKLFTGLNLIYEIHVEEGVVNWSEYDNATWENIGYFFNWSLHVTKKCLGSARYPVGDAFNLQYFKGLLSLTHEESQCDFEKLESKAIISLLNAIISDKSAVDYFKKLGKFLDWNGQMQESAQQKTFLKECVNRYGFEFPDGSFTDNGLINVDLLPEIKEIFRKGLINDYPQARTIHAIARGMKCTKNNWQLLQTRDAESMQDFIAGPFSKDLLLRKLTFIGMSAGQSAIIERFLNNQNDNQLRNFLQAVTGSRCVPQSKISIIAIGTKAHSVSHTCTETLHLSIDDESSEDTINDLLSYYCKNNPLQGFEVD